MGKWYKFYNKETGNYFIVEAKTEAHSHRRANAICRDEQNKMGCKFLREITKEEASKGPMIYFDLSK